MFIHYLILYHCRSSNQAVPVKRKHHKLQLKVWSFVGSTLECSRSQPQSWDSPNDEVEVRECEHDDAEKGGESSVHYRGKHLLQGHQDPAMTVADARQETL